MNEQTVSVEMSTNSNVEDAVKAAVAASTTDAKPSELMVRCWARVRDENGSGRGEKSYMMLGRAGQLKWVDKVDGCEVVEDDYDASGLRSSSRHSGTLVDVPCQPGDYFVEIVKSYGRYFNTKRIVRKVPVDVSSLEKFENGAIDSDDLTQVHARRRRKGEGWALVIEGVEYV